MSDAALYYRHSGRFTPAAVLFTLLIGLAVAALGGALYGVIVYYMPIVYINVLLTIGLGVGLGMFVGKLAMARHVRNVPVVLFLGVLCGIVAEYAAFVGWVYVVTSRQVLALNPAELFLILEAIAETGVWSLKKTTVNGGFLISIWGIEALVIIGGAVRLAYSEIARTPYCETCARWLKETTVIGPYRPVHDAAGLKASLEQGDFAVLGNIAPLKQDDPIDRFAEYELIDCPTCDEMAVVTIRNVTLTADKEGKITRKDANIIDRLLIDKASCDLIKELAPRPEETADEAGESETDANIAALEAADDERTGPSA